LFGINSTCTGKGVKIAILDSGYPQHKSIKISGEKASFCEENIDIEDKIGHATMIAGIINANDKKSIVGFAPHASLLYGKIVNNKGICDFNSLVAGILWAIVQEVNIIVMALGTQYDYIVLQEVIKKAINHNILIFAAAGDNK